jgi:lipoate-protein ligase A
MQPQLSSTISAKQDTSVCQLVIDEPGSGAWNMALDEALLETAAEESGLTLRFYRWEEPTLSLGYFQSYSDRQQHAASQGCPVVRRSSGGGAILHDQEWTYSLCVPAGHRLATSSQRLYDQVHRALVAVLTRLTEGREQGERDSGELALFPEKRSEPIGEERWLCFERRSPGDVLLGDTKITGSAQRRRRGAVLQHGSLLLRRSESAPELPGLYELAGIEIEAQEFLSMWTAELERRLGLVIERKTIPKGVLQRARCLESDKYGCANWTQKR